MLFEITYYERGEESSTYWEAADEDDAREYFSESYPLADILRVDHVQT